MMTCKQPYKDINIFQLMRNVVEGYRPEISLDVPDSYRELIESCWSQDSKERPSFDEIVEKVKNDHGYITDEINEAEFLQEYI